MRIQDYDPAAHGDVVIILGSETDAKDFWASKMTDVLDACGVSWVVYVCSAHRNDEELGNLCIGRVQRNSHVFIAMAGMLGVLAGAIIAKIKAARPVIGVALRGAGSLEDMASLMAVTMTPRGIPVLCSGFGKHGMINAALAAVQIVARSNDQVQVKLDVYVHANTPAPKQLQRPAEAEVK